MEEQIKCVVWDLDNTLWDGVLLEDPAVHLRGGVADVIRTLDRRGVLNSIASRNDPETALDRLEALDLREYFVFPHIGWGRKSTSVSGIAEQLRIGLGAIAFVDDDPFERSEVSHTLPEVRCFAAEDAAGLVDLPELSPAVITGDAARRRAMYQEEESRQTFEAAYEGSPVEFLRQLDMVMTIAEAAPEDLERARELTVRTHQLNTSGRTYSGEELRDLMTRADHRVLTARLEDRFGSYGVIGLVVIATEPGVWTLKLLLMSCRVLARGVGSAMLNHVMREAFAAGVELRAEWVSTRKNRAMLVMLRLAGFRPGTAAGELDVLTASPGGVAPAPTHLRIVA
jgi:FkbH-like protein